MSINKTWALVTLALCSPALAILGYGSYNEYTKRPVNNLKAIDSIIVNDSIRDGIKNSDDVLSNAKTGNIQQLLDQTKDFRKQLDALVILSNNKFEYKTGTMGFSSGEFFFSMFTNLKSVDGRNISVLYSTTDLSPQKTGEYYLRSSAIGVKESIYNPEDILRILAALTVKQGMIDPKVLEKPSPASSEKKGNEHHIIKGYILG